MLYQYEIEVTQDDIEMGIKRSCIGCPIARAIQRVFGVQLLNIIVGVWGVMFTINDKKIRYDIPDIAYSFILDFDERKSVSPFKFTLIARSNNE